MDHPEELTHISLCAGYGGIDLGLRRVIPGIRTIAFSEIEAYAVANLVSKIEAGFLDAAPIWSDLKTFPFASFRGKVDIISGGFPCQPFSSAGRRQGDEDPRHLWPFIVRGLRDASPSICFFENVEGIISSQLEGNDWSDPKGSPVLLHVLRELERLGYRSTAGIFSASEIGAPHQRKRVFILGSKLDHTKHDRLQGSIVKSRCSTATSREELCTTSGNSTSRTLCPSRRGQTQYNWEPPRVLTMGNAYSRPKSKFYECGILSKATKEEKTDINTRASVTRCSKSEQLDNANDERLSRKDFKTAAVDQKRRKKQNGHNAATSTSFNELHGQIKPALGRCFDGSTDWVDDGELYESFDNITDELRLLGNGVVPDTAARAFEVLWNRLNEACIH